MTADRNARIAASFHDGEVQVHFVHTLTIAEELKVKLPADSFLKSYQ